MHGIRRSRSIADKQGRRPASARCVLAAPSHVASGWGLSYVAVQANAMPRSSRFPSSGRARSECRSVHALRVCSARHGIEPRVVLGTEGAVTAEMRSAFLGFFDRDTKSFGPPRRSISTLHAESFARQDAWLRLSLTLVSRAPRAMTRNACADVLERSVRNRGRSDVAPVVLVDRDHTAAPLPRKPSWPYRSDPISARRHDTS
jgi:hypothetical protein